MNKSNQITLGKIAITGNHAFKLEFVPERIAIVGSGYRELEFSDVYTAIGSELSIDKDKVWWTTSWTYLKGASNKKLSGFPFLFSLSFHSCNLD
ncbi:hypothetical protein FXO37_21421 [Capsicum annuum]|nr:hypothetical protein FXO37_21421 [Capsicum annuum]